MSSGSGIDGDTMQFFSLIQMLHRSAVIALGVAPGMDGAMKPEKAEAKAAIDLLMMLQRKTQGNLSTDEKSLVDGMVSELQILFARAPSDEELKEQVAAAEEMEETFRNPTKAPADVIVDDEEE